MPDVDIDAAVDDGFSDLVENVQCVAQVLEPNGLRHIAAEGSHGAFSQSHRQPLGSIGTLRVVSQRPIVVFYALNELGVPLLGLF